MNKLTEEQMNIFAKQIRSGVQDLVKNEVHVFAMNNSLSMEVSALIVLIAELRMLGDLIVKP